VDERQKYRVDEPGRDDLGRHHHVIFCLPFTPAGVPFSDTFDWNAVNYAPLTVGGLILAVGIWWLVRARHSFTGPVRTVEFAGEGLGVETDDPKEPTPA
jgi:hypothetical protein